MNNKFTSIQPVAQAFDPHPIPAEMSIEAACVIPVVPSGVVLRDHSVLVDAGTIVDILPTALARERYLPRQVHRLDGHVLMPGLVNAHTHAAMSLLRGFADDVPLQEWLEQHIWPAEGRFVGPEFVRDGTRLACLEMLSGGITCFADMYFHADEVASVAAECNIRAMVGMAVLDFPTPYAADADTYIARGLAARDAHLGDPLVGWCFAPHAPYSVSNAAFSRIVELADELELGIHVHLHETRREVDDALATTGLRPVDRLATLGVLGPGTFAAHCVHLNDRDRELLGSHHVSLVHCPTSNLKLASGIANIDAAQRAGINIALGTDGAASNNRLDLWQEMRLAALLAKASSGNAAVLGAHEAIRAATLGGAIALGLADRVGTIERGKLADLVAVRLDIGVEQPVYDPASHLVYVAGRDAVSAVWVHGRCQKYDGEMIWSAYSDLMPKIGLWHTRIASSAPRGMTSN